MKTNKKAKGFLHLYCVFSRQMKTCTKFIETYVTLFFENMFKGIFSEEYFCGVIVPTCDLTRDTLESYIENLQNIK